MVALTNPKLKKDVCTNFVGYKNEMLCSDRTMNGNFSLLKEHFKYLRQLACQVFSFNVHTGFFMRTCLGVHYPTSTHQLLRCETFSTICSFDTKLT